MTKTNYEITTSFKHTVLCRLYCSLTDHQESELFKLDSHVNTFGGCMACGAYVELENDDKEQLLKDIGKARKLLGKKLKSKKNDILDKEHTKRIQERWKKDKGPVNPFIYGV